MKIGIAGAEGSGKSDLAKKLARSLNTARNEGEPTFAVIDNYVQDLQKKTGYYYELFAATHPQNFQILFHRWTLEQEAAHKGLNTITCGTLYETIVHVAIHSLIIEQAEPLNPEEVIQIEAAMRGLAMIETLISDYDVIFYLPYSERYLKEMERSWDMVVNSKIPEVLEGYSKNYVVLKGNEKEKVKNARRIVKDLKALIEASENDESTVRGSGGPDSERSEES